MESANETLKARHVLSSVYPRVRSSTIALIPFRAHFQPSTLSFIMSYKCTINNLSNEVQLLSRGALAQTFFGLRRRRGANFLKSTLRRFKWKAAKIHAKTKKRSLIEASLTSLHKSKIHVCKKDITFYCSLWYGCKYQNHHGQNPSPLDTHNLVMSKYPDTGRTVPDRFLRNHHNRWRPHFLGIQDISLLKKSFF